MTAAHRDGVPSYISPITAWEIGMLTSRGRLQLLIKPERWFANLFQVPGVQLADMPPDLLIASSFLPGSRRTIQPIASSRPPRVTSARP